MKRAALIVLTLLLAGCDDNGGTHTKINVTPFGDVELYYNKADARKAVVMISNGGWDEGMNGRAWALAWPDRLIIGVDGAHVRNQCIDPADIHLLLAAAADKTGADISKPLLMGRGAGAQLAYTAASRLDGDVAGVIAEDFCPSAPPACPGATIDATVVMITANCPAVESFAAALPDARVVAPAPEQEIDLIVSVVAQTDASTGGAPHAGALEDLPLIELPADGNDDRLAIILTGDGGWADIDKQIGEMLQTEGIAVVGFNTLTYFWKEQSPSKAAADLERTARHYMQAWNRKRLILVGYSFGANVLPFMIAPLSDDLKQATSLVALLAMEQRTGFEIKVGGWVGQTSTDGPEVAPAVRALAPLPVFCVHGTDEVDDPCPALAADGVEVMTRSGSHHFDGNYQAIADRINAKSAAP